MGDTFRDYGYSFQCKIVSGLLTDQKFAGRIFEILKPEYFESSALKWIVESTISYFIEYKSLPSLEVFKSEIQKTIPSENVALRTEIVTTLKDVAKSVSSEDNEYIKNEVIQFCKNQELKSAMLDSIPLLKNRDYDGIRRRIDDAYKKGSDFDPGHEYLEQIEERYTLENLHRISTGWDVIDELTGGGLPKKKLGTITAALGAGKTFMAVHLGASAIEAGYTVIHCTLELDEYEVGKRYDSRLSGYGLDTIHLHVSDVKKKLSNQKGRLIIKEFLGGVTLYGIENYIDQCILSGIVPDMVIIDYDELIDLPKSYENYRYDQQMQLLYREARRRIAIGKDVALWMPAQATREGSEEDVVRMAHAANSYGKNREVDFAITLSRKDKDKANNTARISIGKSRLGPDGLTFPCHFDTSKGIIRIYRENSIEGKTQQNKMVSDGEHQRQYALNRWNQINGTEDKKGLF